MGRDGHRNGRQRRLSSLIERYRGEGESSLSPLRDGLSPLSFLELSGRERVLSEEMEAYLAQYPDFRIGGEYGDEGEAESIELHASDRRIGTVLLWPQYLSDLDSTFDFEGQILDQEALGMFRRGQPRVIEVDEDLGKFRSLRKNIASFEAIRKVPVRKIDVFPRGVRPSRDRTSSRALSFAWRRDAWNSVSR